MSDLLSELLSSIYDPDQNMPTDHPLPGGELARFLVLLAEADVDFVVCGGIACILHGVSRTTADLDLALRLEKTNIQRFIPVARQCGLQPRVHVPIESLADERQRREWIETKGAVVFTLIAADSPLQVDIFLRYPVDYETLRNNAVAANVEGHTFRISSREHLIKAKQVIQPQRTTDVFDIEALNRLIENERE